MTYQPQPGDTVAIPRPYVHDRAAATGMCAPWASLDEWVALGRLVREADIAVENEAGHPVALSDALAPLRDRLRGRMEGWE